ncbi:MAG: hypothetical protein WCG87_08435 [Bacteroidota bacterium]
MKLLKLFILLSIIGTVACNTSRKNTTKDVVVPVVNCDYSPLHRAFATMQKYTTYEGAAYYCGTGGYQYKKTTTDSAGNVHTYYRFDMCSVDTSVFILANFINDTLVYATKSVPDLSHSSLGVDSLNYLEVIKGLPPYFRTLGEVNSIFGVSGDNTTNTFFYSSFNPTYYRVDDSDRQVYNWYHIGGGSAAAVFQGPKMIFAQKLFIQGK